MFDLSGKRALVTGATGGKGGKGGNGGNGGARPEKPCVACGRPFAWRKKWERDWENVRYLHRPPDQTRPCSRELIHHP